MYIVVFDLKKENKCIGSDEIQGSKRNVALNYKGNTYTRRVSDCIKTCTFSPFMFV